MMMMAILQCQQEKEEKEQEESWVLTGDGVTDIVMAVMVVVLLLCVLELCLGVRLCGVICCGHQVGGMRDPERRGDDTDPPTPEPSEAPPSYDAVMEQGRAETHTRAAEGMEELRRERESVPLKRDFSFHFKLPYDDTFLPMRPPSSPGIGETSFMSPRELWLTVDGLPTYEEAVARLQEEEKEAVATMQEGESGALNQHDEETGRRPKKNTAVQVSEVDAAEQTRGRRGEVMETSNTDTVPQQQEEEAR